jgi:dipeptidase D
MALLSSSDVRHPPLEALFTIDEETGMTGAKQLPGDWLRGRTLLNLDTEDDTELTIGCAGGIDVSTTGHYDEEPLPAGWSVVAVAIRGLTGGHSGMDIHLGRGNANKLMNRLLDVLDDEHGVRICQLDGGGLRNAIPRESVAQVAVPPGINATHLEETLQGLAGTIRNEYQLTDPGLTIAVEPALAQSSVLSESMQRRLLATIDGVMSGIWRMSPSIPGLVQTSNNLARVSVGGGKFELHCLTRSNVDSERDELARILVSVLSRLDGRCETAGSYPGWQPQPDSNIVRVMKRVYAELFGAQPHVAACHAGLECGIIGGHYPGTEMVSFGPNIRGAHSPDEKVQVSSVQKFWKYLTATLARLGESRA